MPAKGVWVFLVYIHGDGIGGVGGACHVVGSYLPWYGEVYGVTAGIGGYGVTLRVLDADDSAVLGTDGGQYACGVTAFRQGVWVVDYLFYLVNVELVFAAVHVFRVDAVFAF